MAEASSENAVGKFVETSGLSARSAQARRESHKAGWAHSTTYCLRTLIVKSKPIGREFTVESLGNLRASGISMMAGWRGKRKRGNHRNAAQEMLCFHL